jgi:adenylyl cyclase-associated protein
MGVDDAITGLVARLEAVAKRLEAVEGQLATGGGAAAAAPSAGATAPGGGDDDEKPFVGAYKALVDEHIGALEGFTAKIGNPEVAEAVAGLRGAVDAQAQFLSIASQAKKPEGADLQKLLEPTSTKITEVGSLFEKHRGHQFSNHLQALAEGIPALGWVVVEPTPGPYVGDMRGGSEFYSNRILKEFKDKDEDQTGWVKAFNTFLRELQTYIKEFHTTGVVWNAQGVDASSVAPASSSSAAPAGGAPPPPGPAPPPPAPVVTKSEGGAAGADMSNVFAELNKGGAVTSGLRKVTKDMTNKGKKISGAVKADAIKKPAAAKRPSYGARTGAAKPAKFGLSGTKWEVEYQDGNKNILIEETESKHTVYAYQCKNSTIVVKGKVNAIIIDSCERVAVVFDNAIASVDIVNSKSIEVQVTGSVPSFSVDKCSSCLLMLSQEAKNAEIVTSKCDSLNVSFPVEGKQDPVEAPVPEQFKTVIVNDELVTDMIRHE